jgi:hypothetical protein
MSMATSLGCLILWSRFPVFLSNIKNTEHFYYVVRKNYAPQGIRYWQLNQGREDGHQTGRNRNDA